VREVPAIVDAPGAGIVIATSNKRDTLDATRSLREREGDVWAFDPQQVAGEPPLATNSSRSGRNGC
jgi:hypothetical protein